MTPRTPASDSRECTPPNYGGGVGRRTLDVLKSAAASFVFVLIAAMSAYADTAILVALPAEQSALSREVRMVGQSVELAQHRVSKRLSPRP
jgi:hypothetical protein